MQDRIKEEIKNNLTKYQDKLTYECVMNEFPYLEAVIKETLRLYPPLPILDRECVVSEYNLEPYCNFKVPYKMPITIPVSAIQMDPEVSILWSFFV